MSDKRGIKPISVLCGIAFIYLRLFIYLLVLFALSFSLSRMFACTIGFIHAVPAAITWIITIAFPSLQLIIRKIYLSDMKYDKPNLAAVRTEIWFNATYVGNKSRSFVRASRFTTLLSY